MSDRNIIDAWKRAGGTFYGPHVEHADMEYAKWLPFMRGLADSVALRTALEDIAKAAKAWPANDAAKRLGRMAQEALKQ